MEDEFTEEGDVREEYGEDDHFVVHRCDRPPLHFELAVIFMLDILLH